MFSTLCIGKKPYYFDHTSLELLCISFANVAVFKIHLILLHHQYHVQYLSQWRHLLLLFHFLSLSSEGPLSPSCAFCSPESPAFERCDCYMHQITILSMLLAANIHPVLLRRQIKFCAQTCVHRACLCVCVALGLLAVHPTALTPLHRSSAAVLPWHFLSWCYITIKHLFVQDDA